MRRQTTRFPWWDRRPRIPLLVTWLLVVIATLGTIDLVLDAPSTWLSFHVLVEIAFVALCLASAAYLGAAWLRTERSLRRVRRALREKRSERDQWRHRAQHALRGLGEAIDAQLESWALTPTEKETALLVMRGFSHKEIAALCARSERTVRQHAVSVYRKSGLSGRAELSAFFLEDLLLPAAEDDQP